MKKILILLLFFCATICNAQNYTNVKSKDFNVYGELNIFTTKDSLKKAFAKMKIVNYQDANCSFGDEHNKVKFYHYSKNGVTYLVYNNKADIVEIDFRNDSSTFLKYKNLKIDTKNNLRNFKKIFSKKLPKL